MFDSSAGDLTVPAGLPPPVVRALGELVPGALGALGLADGDVLERLDGRPLDTPDRWLEVYTRSTSGTLDRTVLTVLRGGRETTVDVVVR